MNVEVFKVNFNIKTKQNKPQLCTGSIMLAGQREGFFNFYFHYFLSKKMGYKLYYNMSVVKSSLKSAEAAIDMKQSLHLESEGIDLSSSSATY